MPPLLTELAVPVLKIVAPLEVAVPCPVPNEISPPVAAVLSLETTNTPPPFPLVAAPVVMVKCPLLRKLVAPDLNVIAPLVPAVPTFTMTTEEAPLVDLIPAPLKQETEPPVKTGGHDTS
jgi:hypothetical protein